MTTHAIGLGLVERQSSAMRPHEAFPNDDQLWQLVLVGQILPNVAVPEEAQVECRIRRVEWRTYGPEQERLVPCGEDRLIPVGIGYARALVLGSLWRNRSPVNVSADLTTLKARVDPATSSLVRLKKANNVWIRPFSFDELPNGDLADAEAYIAVNTQDDLLVIIPVWEAIRRFYAPTSLLSRELFYFDGTGNSSRLYDPGRTGFMEDGTFVIAPSRELDRDEAIYLSTLIATPNGRAGFAMISASVNAAWQNGRPAYPTCLFPFSQVAAMEFLGINLDPNEFGTNIGEVDGVFLALQIRKADPPQQFNKLLIYGQTSVGGGERGNTRLRRVANIQPQRGTKVQSRRSPSFKFAREEEAEEDLCEVLPYLADIEITYTQANLSARPNALIPVAGGADPEELSTASAAAADGDVGELDMTIEIPVKAGNEGIVDLEPEAIGAGVLFVDDEIEPLRVRYEWPPIAYPLETLCLAARRLVTLPSLRSVGMVGPEDRADFSHGFALIDLPREWGHWCVMRTDQFGDEYLRRVAIVELRTVRGYRYAFDIERRKRSEPIAILVLAHSLGARLSDADLARVLRYAVQHEGVWPQRKDFGDIFTRRLKHSQNHLFAEGLAYAISTAEEDL